MCETIQKNAYISPNFFSFHKTYQKLNLRPVHFLQTFNISSNKRRMTAERLRCTPDELNVK
jgi:hypothetical protein